jgi:hypothetical protein
VAEKKNKAPVKTTVESKPKSTQKVEVPKETGKAKKNPATKTKPSTATNEAAASKENKKKDAAAAKAAAAKKIADVKKSNAKSASTKAVKPPAKPKTDLKATNKTQEVHNPLLVSPLPRRHKQRQKHTESQSDRRKQCRREF